MLPFATKTDLDEAAKSRDVSDQVRTSFLDEMCAEHDRPNARAQLKDLWSNWLSREYPCEQDSETEQEKHSVRGRCKTPTDEEMAAQATQAQAAAAAASSGGPH